uniref:Uncharacterized protein n=1 Tax=Parascaris equorum TaxID=6256 RepID=A0A914RKZ0_PAREQ
MYGFQTNTTSAATMRLRLISYTNPTLGLPDGRTCVCPTGKSCPYLQQGIPSCMFSFTMAIDVFVHHLGVVIDGATAQLEFYNYVIHVDTFVVSLANYDASVGVSVSTTAKGLLQGTT